MIRRVRGIPRRFRFPWRTTSQIEREVDDELDFHIAMQAEALEREGLSPKEARDEALRRFGNLADARRQLARSGWRGERLARWQTMIEDCWRDVRYGARSLARSPGFTAIAVSVLALGIGANSAVFSLIDVLLVRPVLMQNPEEVVGIYAHTVEQPGAWRLFSYPEYGDIRELNRTFSDVAAYQTREVGLVEEGLTRRTEAFFVSANYFRTFGVPVAYGREFTTAEEGSGTEAAVVVVSYDFWARNGRDPAMLGSLLRVNGEPVAVVGIAAEGFTGHGVGAPELWLPLGMLERFGSQGPAGLPPRLDDPENGMLYLFGRIDADSSVAEAEADLDTLAPRFGADRAAAGGAGEDFVLAPLGRFSIGNAPANDEGALAVAAALLTGMTGIVLLIACINLANMLLARGAGRRNEMAIRQALGGNRLRLVRQLLLEAMILSLAGGIGGLIFGYWAARGLVSSAAASPFGTALGALDVRPDAFVLAGTFASCIGATLLFGLGPAWSVSGDIAGVLKKSGGRAVSGARRAGALLAPRNLLVVAQIALSLALLTAGGLFARATLDAGEATPGYRLEPIVLAELDPSLLGYDEARSREIYREALERVRSLPAVEHASLSSLVPFDNTVIWRRAKAAGGGGVEASEVAWYFVVSDDYFATLDLPVLRGRAFTPSEVSSGSGSRVTIIDEPLAERLFGSANEALGRLIELPGGQILEAAVLEVVGVVPGVRDPTRNYAPAAHVYVPFGQHYVTPMHLHVRIAETVEPAAMLDAIRNELLAVDQALPVLSLTTMIGHRDKSMFMWGTRTAGRMFGVLGGLALLLAVVGVYGVKAFLAARRTREIGVRMALGATRADIVQAMLRESLGVTVAGLGLGVLLAAVIARLLSSTFFGMRPVDPLVFLGSATLLAAAAMAAAYLPARRATRIDPTAALRHE